MVALFNIRERFLRLGFQSPPENPMNQHSRAVIVYLLGYRIASIARALKVVSDVG